MNDLQIAAKSLRKAANALDGLGILDDYSIAKRREDFDRSLQHTEHAVGLIVDAREQVGRQDPTLSVEQARTRLRNSKKWVAALERAKARQEPYSPRQLAFHQRQIEEASAVIEQDKAKKRKAVAA